MQPQSRTLGFVRPSHGIFAFRLIRFTAAESAVRPSTGGAPCAGSELLVLLLEKDCGRGEQTKAGTLIFD